MIGCYRKLQRLFEAESRRAVVLSLDHGASDGLAPGLDDLPALLNILHKTPVEGVVLNKGVAQAYGDQLPVDLNLVVQLSGGTRHGLPTYNKSLVCGVAEAMRLGADMVAVQVNIGNDLEDRMLQDLGRVTEEAHELGLPVMAVVMARGGQIVNELDPSLIGHCIRLGGELGADVVSAPYSGDVETYGRAITTCPVPVLIAGGAEQPDFDSFLQQMSEALSCGAAGLLVGRNVFRQPEPEKALEQLLELVHGGFEE